MIPEPKSSTEPFHPKVYGSASQRFFTSWVAFAGVILPVIALVTECLYRLCKEIFFDPVPTPMHLVLVALVPLVNLVLLVLGSKTNNGLSRWKGWLSGLTIGISAFYSLFFLPLAPFSAIAIIVYGLGFLPLAPPLSLIASIAIYRRHCRPHATTAHALWLGMLCALGILLGVEARATATRIGMNMAASLDESTQVRGLRLLRSLGDKDLMLEYCYGGSKRATDLIGNLFSLGDPVGSEPARKIYYRALGLSFNAQPRRAASKHDRFDFWNQRAEQGGAAVAGVVPGLSLSGSRIDATIDAQAAVAYQEWTLEFENSDFLAAEARAQIQLPPEGVVSRLTLWVHGEEREAVFASRGQTREAYEKVVRARRDPVLVTTQGPDRILMQCFPVPGNGGHMKVRLGITSPLSLSLKGDGYFHLPRFTERNFDIPSGPTAIGHSVWMEANEPFRFPGLPWVALETNGKHTLKGSVSEAALSEGPTFIVGSHPLKPVAWARESTPTEDYWIQQRPETVEVPPLANLTLVVDGSQGMKPYFQKVCEKIRRSNRDIRVFFAGSETVMEFKGTSQEVANALERLECLGGQDNVLALLRARESLPTGKESDILWITAPQPFLLSSVEGLRQSLERGTVGQNLVLQLGHGPNRVVESLEDLHFTEVRPTGSWEEELQERLSPFPISRVHLKRTPIDFTQQIGEGKETSSHLVRLYAREEIAQYLQERKEPARKVALNLATAFRLVTPVSGAVVLETDAQYREAGLEPGQPASVPGVPEPEMIGLALILALFLIFYLKPLRYFSGRRP